MPNNITTNNPQVREFITNNDAEGLAEYFSGLPHDSTLTFISRHDDAADLHQLQIIAQALENNQTITTFNLSHNNINASRAAAIAGVVATNSAINALDLSFNNIGDAGAALLADALAQNTTVTHLNIAGNSIGPAGATAIAHLLATNANIAQFNLSWNNIGPAGAGLLADALAINSAITDFNLADNNIGNDGAAAIAGSLAMNPNIIALDFSLNNIGAAGAAAIDNELTTNRLINEFIDSLKQNVSFDGGINMVYLMPYFDFSPEAKAKINKKLFQEKAIDADGQEHSVASLICDSTKPVESAVMKQIGDGAKPSGIEEVITRVPEVVIESILPHLESHDLVALFQALHFNNQANQQELNDGDNAPEDAITHEGSPEVNTSGCLPECCIIS